MAKRYKPRDDLKPEDCTTPELKLEYSRMMYERYQSIGENEPPSVLLDFDRFPPETEEWMSPEYWIAVARAEREKRRLLYGK
jgi:hypothetical protein